MPPRRPADSSGGVARILVREQSETGRPAARHAHELGARLIRQPVDDLANDPDLRPRRHFEVVGESLRSDIRAVAEGVVLLGQRLVLLDEGLVLFEDRLVALAERPHLKSRIVSDTDVEGMLDGHAVCVSGARPGTVFLAVRMGLFQSADRGASWQTMDIGRFSPLTYSRDILVSPHDPRDLYACLSPAARSVDGSLYRSRDVGETWTRFDHGVKAGSTMMAVALHRRDPDQVYCVSRHGQVFGTLDGGRTWSEQHLPDGVQDVYAIACG